MSYASAPGAKIFSGSCGMSPRKPAEVALITTSNFLPPSAAYALAEISQGVAPLENRCTSASALFSVRLAITNARGDSPSSGPATPNDAPPAPSSSTFLPRNAQARFTMMSRTRPAPSVLSPMMSSTAAAPPAPSEPKASTLTAPACSARPLLRVANANASCLNGRVIFRPLPPAA